MKDPRRIWEDEGIQLSHVSLLRRKYFAFVILVKMRLFCKHTAFLIATELQKQFRVVAVLHRSLNRAVNTQIIKNHHTLCCRHNLNYATQSTLFNVQFNKDMHLTQGNYWKSSFWFANHIYLYTGTINSTASNMSPKLKQTNKFLLPSVDI